MAIKLMKLHSNNTVRHLLFPAILLAAGLSFSVQVSCAHSSQPVETKKVQVPGLGPEETVPDLPGIESCSDAPLIPINQMAAGVGANERIAFDAVPSAMVVCTALFCGYPKGKEDEPICCNECMGGYDVETRGLRIYIVGIGGCNGYDCNYHCEPFGREPIHKYRFVGKNEFKTANEARASFAVSMFTVEKVCGPIVLMEDAGIDSSD